MIFNKLITSSLSPPGVAGTPYPHEVCWKLYQLEALARMLWPSQKWRNIDRSSVAFESSESLQPQQKDMYTMLRKLFLPVKGTTSKSLSMSSCLRHYCFLCVFLKACQSLKGSESSLQVKLQQNVVFSVNTALNCITMVECHTDMNSYADPQKG